MSKDSRYYAVTGNPILHSKSPLIFNSLFKLYSLNNYYSRMEARSAEESITTFRRLNLSGMNVTTPFKSDIIPFLDEIDEHSKKIEAVNTIKLEGNKLVGFNTDFLGVVGAIKDHGVELENKKCIVVGSGNAGRAAIYGILKEGTDVIVVNRTYEKALKSALDFNCKAEKIENLNSILNDSDILVSTIPNCEEYIKSEDLRKGLVLLNADYKDKSIDRIFEQAGCIVIPGEEWLYYQAIPAFEIFTDHKIDKIYEKIDLNYDSIDSKKVIALIGFMGTGKTTIGKILAEKLSVQFIDTDNLIEKREGMAISEIFITKGEQYYREIEKSTIKEIMMDGPCIISCGGGIVTESDSRLILKEHCINIFLYSSLETCIQRANDKSRPLVNNLTLNELNDLFNERFSLYYSNADLIVNNEEKIDIALDTILNEIKLFNNQ